MSVGSLVRVATVMVDTVSAAPVGHGRTVPAGLMVISRGMVADREVRGSPSVRVATSITDTVSSLALVTNAVVAVRGDGDALRAVADGDDPVTVLVATSIVATSASPVSTTKAACRRG